MADNEEIEYGTPEMNEQFKKAGAFPILFPEGVGIIMGKELLGIGFGIILSAEVMTVLGSHFINIVMPLDQAAQIAEAIQYNISQHEKEGGKDRAN